MRSSSLPFRAALALLVPLAHTAYADSNAAKADALFAQGRTAMNAGKFAEACGAFDESQKLAPSTPTLFNQADCREKNGQLATAARLFSDAERATRGAVDAVGKKLHQTAVDRLAELNPRLSHMTVKVGSHPDGMTVRRDDAPVPPGEWNHPMPIDAGTYTFTARVGDKDVWSETVTVGIAGDDAGVEVALPASSAAGGASTNSTAAPSSDVQPSAPAASPSTLNAKLATIGAGVLLGGALGVDLWSESTYSSAKQMRSESLWTSANNQLYAAQGMLYTGLACGALATYLWFHERGEAKHTVTPMVAPGTAGVSLGGAW